MFFGLFIGNKDFQMANIENNSEKNDKQRSHFAGDQELKAKVYDAIEEQLKKSSEKAFDSEGFKSRVDTAMKKDDETNWNRGEGERGFNKGVYGDGSTYGMGTKKGEVSVTINRVKGPKSTNGFFEKNLSFGGKRMTVEIHVDIDVESKTMDMTYKTTEMSFFRGHHDKKGPFMIDDELFFRLDSMDKFKKELKKKFDDYAEREANYFIKTKLGIEDRVQKSINSMVENNMKKLSLKDIINSDYDETLDKIMESSKDSKKNKVDQNHPEVKDANSPNNLLFDDLEECESKMGKDYRDYFEKKMKKYGASSPKELKPSEWETIDMGWTSDKEAGLEEVTGSAGGAGAGAYQTPGAFAKGGDFDDEMGKSPENKAMKRSLKEKFEETPYSKKGKKRTLKRESSSDGWTTVELEPGSGYVPKGMNKNHALNLHGVEVNSEEEEELSKGSPKGRAAMDGKKSKGLSESFDPAKRKFLGLTENEEKGVNKRYIITHKKTKNEEKSRWSQLSNFEKESTIKLAESCGNDEPEVSHKEVSREQGEEENKKDFMKRNQDIDAGDKVDGKEVVVVAKPESLSGAEFKVYEEDYLNESKAYIFDFNTGELVKNPNYNIEVINEEVKRKTKDQLINENVSVKPKAKEVPNKAYYFDEEKGRMIRNRDFKA